MANMGSEAQDKLNHDRQAARETMRTLEQLFSSIRDTYQPFLNEGNTEERVLEGQIKKEQDKLSEGGFSVQEAAAAVRGDALHMISDIREGANNYLAGETGSVQSTDEGMVASALGAMNDASRHLLSSPSPSEAIRETYISPRNTPK